MRADAVKQCPPRGRGFFLQTPPEVIAAAEMKGDHRSRPGRIGEHASIMVSLGPEGGGHTGAAPSLFRQ